MRRNILVVIIGVFLLVLASAVYFNISNETEETTVVEESENESVVIEEIELPNELYIKSLEEFNYELTKDEVELYRKSRLLNIKYLKGVNKLIYAYDEDENILALCYENMTYYFNLENATYTQNGLDEKMNDIIEVVDGQLYINIETSEELFNFEYITLDDVFFRLEINTIAENKNINIVSEKMQSIRDKQPEKIMMTWEAVYSRTPDVSKLYEMDGLNVISPVWYELTNSDGSFNSKKTDDYIEWARNMNYDLWPAVTNSFDPEMTSVLLNSASNRVNFITNIVNVYSENGFSGINIDFENIYKADKDILSLFIAELTSAFHRKEMLVSIDVTFGGGSDNWSKCYDRKVLGEWVDYIVVMSYDEHWGSSPVSGSVASLNWVDKGIENLLSEVPSEKIIMGIPFYMRVWFERPSKDTINNMKVTSDAITMFKMEKILAENEHNILWDKAAGQYYISFIDIKDNAVKKIWIEDETSLKLKVELVHKYNLKGIASWRRGYELESIWKALNDVLRKKDD